jgi:peptide/nickel transport system substrate-binding protein
MRPKVVFAVIALVACLAPAAASSAGAASPPGTTLRVALAQTPDALDPVTALTSSAYTVLHQICEPLYNLDANGAVLPALATSLPKVSANRLTLTIPLRHGVQFNDGTPFDAAAVKASLDDARTNKLSSFVSNLSPVKSVAVVNPYELRVVLSKPFPALPELLATDAGMVVSPTARKSEGANFSRHPVCVGPFTFVSRPSSGQINVAKSQYYYDRAKVTIPSISFTTFTDPDIRAVNLRAGAVDVAEALGLPQVETLSHDTNVVVQSNTGTSTETIWVNVANAHGGNKPYATRSTPLAQHRELREAFSLAINRDAINKVLFGGQYTPNCTPIPPNVPLALKFGCPAYNLAEAKKLVAQSGVPTPIPVQMLTVAGLTDDARVASIVQSMVAQAGFKLSIVPTEHTTLLNDLVGGSYDTALLFNDGAIDPDLTIAAFFLPGSFLNITGANDPAVTSGLQRGLVNPTNAGRKAIYDAVFKKMLFDGNAVWLYQAKVFLAHSNKVSNIVFNPDGLMYLAFAKMQ